MQSQVSTPKFKQRIASLTAYLVRRLGLRSVPTLQLKQNAENAKKDFGYTGDYDRVNHRIRIFVTGRHQNDVLRTLSHELIHHWQNERGVLSPSGNTPDKGTGQESDTSYAQNDEQLRKCEWEAYLFGNILFRDWQDENRHGPPPQPPTLPPTFL